MPDATDTTTTEGSTTTESAEGTTSTTTTETAGEEFDKERAMATISKLREAEKEGKKAQKERDELKSRLDALEAEKLSEEEKKTKRLDELENTTELQNVKLRGQELRLQTYGLQGELGIADVDLAIAALDVESLEWKDDKPVNLKEVLTGLLESKPILKETKQSAGTGGRTGSTTDAGAGSGNGEGGVSLTAEELEWCKVTGYDPKKYAQAKQVKDLGSYEEAFAQKSS